MGKQFAVCHVTKYKASSFSSGGLGRHIDREITPDNVDETKSHLNFEIVESELSMKKQIEKRLSEGYKGKKEIRKDAVIDCGVIFSGSTEQMKKIESIPFGIETWAADTFEFAKQTFGEENIVRATVHMDEGAPHMHLHFVPLTKDGRLSAKEIISRGKLKLLQDEYARVMEPHGLVRGIEGSKQKHITTKQYYQELNETARDAKSILKHEHSEELVAQLLQENRKLQQEKEIKQNPDKSNYYGKNEKFSRKAQREQEQPNRRNQKTDRGGQSLTR